jgi:hypothetical protein
MFSKKNIRIFVIIQLFLLNILSAQEYHDKHFTICYPNDFSLFPVTGSMKGVNGYKITGSDVFGVLVAHSSTEATDMKNLIKNFKTTLSTLGFSQSVITSKAHDFTNILLGKLCVTKIAKMKAIKIDWKGNVIKNFILPMNQGQLFYFKEYFAANTPLTFFVTCYATKNNRKTKEALEEIVKSLKNE